MPRSRQTFIKAGAALSAAILVGACSADVEQERNITLTFVSNAQSEAALSKVISTTVPGPGISKEGREQAEQVGDTLRGDGYDGVYASTMLRAQQTAAPLSKELGEDVQVLPGLEEIPAGRFEGQPESLAPATSTYLLAPLAWLQGSRDASVPGTEVSGNSFNGEFSGAVQSIYDGDDANAVVFSHGGSIMIWTLMNVRNPRMDLLESRPLPDAGRIVVTGNPANGWTLVNWDGITLSS